MRRNVLLGGLPGVVLGMLVVSMRGVRVMRSLLVVAGFMMLGGFFVVTRRVLMMLGGRMVMVCGFLRHLCSPQSLNCDLSN